MKSFFICERLRLKVLRVAAAVLAAIAFTTPAFAAKEGDIIICEIMPDPAVVSDSNGE